METSGKGSFIALLVLVFFCAIAPMFLFYSRQLDFILPMIVSFMLVYVSGLVSAFVYMLFTQI